MQLIALAHWFGDVRSWQEGAAEFSSLRTTLKRPSNSWISSRRAAIRSIWLATATTELSRGSSADYAVMTIDRMLPDIDGLAIIRRLREGGIVTPVLIISALGEIDDRVRGLRAGGDDYLVKPFAFAELLARVEALARRSVTVVKETVLRVGDLELDLVSRAVSRCGRTIELLPREFQVLEYLVRNEGQVVPRAMLLQHVWDLHFDPTTNIIDVYVGRVRRKIDGQQAYPLIHTVRGIGFCVRAPR
jgi:two-component system OmpR family response regulator